MTFAWSNLSKNTLRELARAAGLKVTKAEDELRLRFGEPPTEELVAVTWLALRDGWVLRTPEAREAIVERLRAAKLGRTDVKVKTRAGQMEYLKSCRTSDTLRRVVHEVLLDVGGRSFDAGLAAATSPDRRDDAQEIGQLLQQACASLRPESMAYVEYSICTTVGAALKGLVLPVHADDRLEVAASIATGRSLRCRVAAALRWSGRGRFRPTELG